MLGTPTYASPEQLRGEHVTARSDLYSWALIFLECLTGHRVVDGPTLQAIIFKQLGPRAHLHPRVAGAPPARADAAEGDGRRTTSLRDITAQQLARELEACAAEGWPVSGSMEGTPTPHFPPSLSSLSFAGEGERRQLTAVCSSLRLSQEEGAAMDEEDLDKLMRSLHVTCAELARSYEGYVGGVLGESMLFYFGYPQAHEDDARRAARAVLEMGVWMQQRAEELAREKKGRLEFRAGLHTGLVIIQERRRRAGLPALMGTTPHTAARLQGLAEHGTLLISEDTRSCCATPSLRAGPERTRCSGPVSLGRCTSTRRAQAGGGDPGGPAVRPLARAGAASGSAGSRRGAAAGRPSCVSGEAGIGKSRLAQELERHVAEHARTPSSRRTARRRAATARCAPWWSCWSGWLGLGRDWTAEQTVRALEKLLCQLRLRAARGDAAARPRCSTCPRADRYPPPAVSPQRVKELTLEALLALLCEMAEHQPVLLLVEDLHWADATTRELLTKLVEAAPSTRLCAVLTARPEFSAPWSSAQVLQVQLGRLERERVEEMVRGLTRDGPLPRELVEQVVTAPTACPSSWRSSPDAHISPASPGRPPDRRDAHALPRGQPLAIPTTLRDSLMARLDRLGPAQETAQLAAALGREFSLEVLKAVSPRDEAVAGARAGRAGGGGPRLPAALAAQPRLRLQARPGARHGLRAPCSSPALGRCTRASPRRWSSASRSWWRRGRTCSPCTTAAASQRRQALDYARKAALGALLRSAHHEALAHATEALGWLEAVEDARERAQMELGLNELLISALMAPAAGPTRGSARWWSARSSSSTCWATARRSPPPCGRC